MESSVARRDFIYHTVTFLNFLNFFLAQIVLHWGYVVTIAQDLPVEEGIDFFFFLFWFLQGFRAKGKTEQQTIKTDPALNIKVMRYGKKKKQGTFRKIFHTGIKAVVS